MKEERCCAVTRLPLKRAGRESSLPAWDMIPSRSNRGRDSQGKGGGNSEKKKMRRVHRERRVFTNYPTRATLYFRTEDTSCFPPFRERRGKTTDARVSPIRGGNRAWLLPQTRGGTGSDQSIRGPSAKKREASVLNRGLYAVVDGERGEVEMVKKKKLMGPIKFKGKSFEANARIKQPHGESRIKGKALIRSDSPTLKKRTQESEKNPSGLISRTKKRQLMRQKKGGRHRGVSLTNPP